jgi:hypothetical protein
MKTMRKFIVCLLMSFIGLTSCVVAQSVDSDYRPVYYDYVITGLINDPAFVNDGFYSYHIVGTIPSNVYWELLPCGIEVGLYNQSGIFIRNFVPVKRWIFYNHSRHHYYDRPRGYQPKYRTQPRHNNRPQVRQNKSNNRPQGKPNTQQHNNGGRGRR